MKAQAEVATLARTGFTERTHAIPAQFQVLLDGMLDQLQARIAIALERPDEMPAEWGVVPCLEGEMIEITMRRVLPVTEPRASRA